MDWTKFIELGIVGLCLFVVLYYIFRHHIPKLMDTFEKSLDTITSRHSEDMSGIGTSLNTLSSELTKVREALAGCKFKQEN